MAKKYVYKEVISIAKKHKIQVMHANGYRNTKIAEALGVSEAVVARVLDVTERS